MPVTLYHGPASHAKKNTLLDLIKQQKHSQDFILLTSNRSSVTQYKNEILKLSAQNIILGELVLTFDEFLLKTIKLSLPRVHLADRDFCHYLLFLILETQYPKVLKGQLNKLKIIKDIFDFFHQVKSCGLSPALAQAKLGEHIESKILFPIFDEYQKQLRALYYFDPADLYLEVLNLIKKRELKFPEKLQTIFITDIYPLAPGQREIIRQLKTHYPQLRIEIFYDEDFSRNDDLLLTGYQDLGDIADHSKFIASEESSQQTLYQFKNPRQEIEFLVNHISKAVVAGTKPESIAIVINNIDYLYPFLLKLNQKNLSAALHINLPVKMFLNQPFDRLRAGPSSKDRQFFLEQLIHQDNFFTDQKIKALAVQEDFLSKMDFLDSTLTTLSTQLSAEIKKAFINELQDHLTLSIQSFEGQIVLTDLHHAQAYSQRNLLITGFYLENFLLKTENAFYSPYLWSHRDLAELLHTPSFQLKIALEKIRHILQTCSHAVFTMPKADFAQKEVSPLQSEFSFQTIITQEQTADEFAIINREPAKDFAAPTKQSYSVSELQEYLNCPYKYYASYHLKLGRSDVENLDLPPDIKGQFVHAVLNRLIEEQPKQYRKALQDSSAREELLKTVKTLMTEEIKKIPDWEKFHPLLSQSYQDRVYTTIGLLLNQEAQFHQEKKKQSLPYKMEWPFTYEMATSLGEVKITGRIDRLDECAQDGSFTVIDYKTGEHASLSDMKNGKSIQLPIYLMAVQNQIFPGHAQSGAFYYGLKQTEVKGFALAKTADADLVSKRSQVSEQDWEEIQSTTTLAVEKAIGGIRSGAFAPNPNNIRQCSYCDYKMICGFTINEEDEESGS